MTQALAMKKFVPEIQASDLKSSQKKSVKPSIDDLLGPVGFIERKGSVGVLLIHGLTGTPTEMKQFGKVIARQGFTVACPELAGHCATIEAYKATKGSNNACLSFGTFSHRKKTWLKAE